MTLSIIIVSYNTKEFLKNCLQSIVENVSNDLDFEVIVVDNNSTDGTVQAIRSSEFRIQNKNLELKIIENRENLGFSKANNIGVKHSKGDYVLFLNSDTVVYKNTLEKMVEFMDQHPDAGAATCKLELPNGKIDDASHRGFPTPWNAFCHFSGLSKIFRSSLFFNGYNLGWRDLDEVHQIDALAGAFMMVRKKAGEQVGWWDEDYFFYGEDLDFCYRLKTKSPSINSGQGWKIYYVSSVSILHYKGISGGIKKHSQHLTTADKETRKRATKARFDAMRIFYKKHYQNKYPKLVTWVIMQGIHLKESLQ